MSSPSSSLVYVCFFHALMCTYASAKFLSAPPAGSGVRSRVTNGTRSDRFPIVPDSTDMKAQTRESQSGLSSDWSHLFVVGCK